MSEEADPSDYTPSRRKTLADETFVIESALERFGAPPESRGIVLPAGDDAAVIDCAAPEFLVVTCDSAVAGVHFKRKWLSFKQRLARDAVGTKSVLSAASDIAAMGATPKFIVVSAGLPSDISRAEVSAILDGVERGCRLIEAVAAGGNTTSSPEIFLDITVIGQTSGRKFVRRSGAAEGDRIFVTGEIGAAHAGLVLFEKFFERKKNRRAKTGSPAKSEHRFVEKFCAPIPRIKIGLALCSQKIATAMTDISDGLLADLRSVTSASGKGAEIFAEKIPASDFFKTDIKAVLTSGGDYELLFTAPKNRAEEIARISEKFRMPVTEIGKITAKKSVRIFLRGKEIDVAQFGAGGFVHNKTAEK